MGNYFEGWYFKHQKERETLAVIVGRAEDGAFIQVITGEGSRRVRFPLSTFHKGKKNLHLADSRFSPKGVRLAVRHPELTLTGQLHYGPLSPIGGDIMGPFRFLPMQCRHQIISMNHSLIGNLHWDGRELDFTGGNGYIEGDAGRSFPKSYTWVQCNAFAENCSIMASVAHIPFGWSWFWGCICVVWLNGVEYRLATYRGAKIHHRDERQLILVQKDLTLKILFLRPHAGYALDAPRGGRMQRSIREVPSALVYFEFRQGNRVLFQGESPFASYEQVF